jgi:hypothetical protein
MTRVIEIVRRGRPGADGASGVVQVLRSEESVTLSSANRGFAIVADDDIAVQLPPASGIGAAWSAWFLAEAGAITLTSTSNINGSASDLLIPQGYSAQVLTDGTEYLVQFGIAEPVLTVNTNSIGNESDVAGTTLTDALNQIDIDIDALTQNQSNALSGGTADQALFKVNSDPFNAEWRALPELTEPQATDPASTVLGLVRGQRLDQAVAARAPVGRVLASGTFSAATTVDIPLPSGQQRTTMQTSARIILTISAASVADVALDAQFTRDNFATVINASGAYRWGVGGWVLGVAGVNQNAATDDKMRVILGSGNAGLNVSPSARLDLLIEEYAGGDRPKRILGRADYINNLSNQTGTMTAAQLLASPANDAVNGVRVIPSSGNITGAYFVVSA